MSSLSMPSSTRWGNRKTKDPLRHRKRPFEHLKPNRLAITVVKNTAMKLSLVSNRAVEQERDPLEALAVYQNPEEAFYLIGPAIAKDVSIISMQRLFEYIALQMFDEKTAGRFMRDVKAEALYKARKKHDPNAVMARLKVAYSMFMVGARCAVIPYLSIYTVEETILFGSLVWKRYRKDQLTKQAQKRLENARLMQSEIYKDPNASYAEREKVGKELKIALQEMDSVERNYRVPALRDVLARSGTLLLRSVGSIASEGTGVAVGSFFWPGIGTNIGQFIGSIVCWMI